MNRIRLSRDQVERLLSYLDDAKENASNLKKEKEINNLQGNIKNLLSEHNPYQLILDQELKA